jgi:hypothetical protein
MLYVNSIIFRHYFLIFAQIKSYHFLSLQTFYNYKLLIMNYKWKNDSDSKLYNGIFLTTTNLMR